jgi:Zinc finger C-x8-C-x5-C-x3-H type (and similar)
MNFNRGFLNNKFGIFGEEEADESDSDPSTSSCFSVKSQIQSKPKSIPTFYSKKNRHASKPKKRYKSNLQKLFKSLGSCFFFQTGRCNRGPECRFEHNIVSLKHKHCKYFQQGRCKFGETCLFNHAIHLQHVQILQNEINHLKDINTKLRKKLQPKLQPKIAKNPTLYSTIPPSSIKVISMDTPLFSTTTEEHSIVPIILTSAGKSSCIRKFQPSKQQKQLKKTLRPRLLHPQAELTTVDSDPTGMKMKSIAIMPILQQIQEPLYQLPTYVDTIHIISNKERSIRIQNTSDLPAIKFRKMKKLFGINFTETPWSWRWDYIEMTSNALPTTSPANH